MALPRIGRILGFGRKSKTPGTTNGARRKGCFPVMHLLARFFGSQRRSTFTLGPPRPAPDLRKPPTFKVIQKVVIKNPAGKVLVDTEDRFQNRQELLIGRLPQNHLMIIHGMISGEHGYLCIANGDLHFGDSGSKHGSTVNSYPVTDEILVRIRFGKESSIVLSGEVSLTFKPLADGILEIEVPELRNKIFFNSNPELPPSD